MNKMPAVEQLPFEAEKKGRLNKNMPKTSTEFSVVRMKNDQFRFGHVDNNDGDDRK